MARAAKTTSVPRAGSGSGAGPGARTHAPDATPSKRRGPTATAAARNDVRPDAQSAVDLDRVIHERARLAIVSALAGAPSLTFNGLKALIGITDGNLSVHARKLEEAGFIACDKTFVDRVPRTAYRLTPAGRKALDAYLAHMEALIQRVREG